MSSMALLSAMKYGYHQILSNWNATIQLWIKTVLEILEYLWEYTILFSSHPLLPSLTTCSICEHMQPIYLLNKTVRYHIWYNVQKLSYLLMYKPFQNLTKLSYTVTSFSRQIHKYDLFHKQKIPQWWKNENKNILVEFVLNVF